MGRSMASARPLDITTNIDRFSEPPPPAYTRKVGLESDEPTAPTMSMAEYKRLQADEEKKAAQAEVDRMQEMLSEVKEPPFSIPRVDHTAAGTLESGPEKSMFYATSNAIYGAGNGLAFETKPFRRRGLDGTFTTWAAGDQISLQASGEPVWGRQGLDCSATRSGCLPAPTAWGSLPMNPPTCTTSKVKMPDSQ